MENTVLIPPLSGAELMQHFIDAIEAKDRYTKGHSHHVAAVVNAVYGCLPPRHRARLDGEKLYAAAMLHDIGKIHTPDYVLNKDGALTGDEWQIMCRHPQSGSDILKETCFAEMCDWILYHHERIDGRGYYGLAGESIPFEARIIAVADTFSALRTYRVYRPAKTIDETMRILRECAGAQLDAEITEYFLGLGAHTLETLECGCEICSQRRRALEEKACAE